MAAPCEARDTRGSCKRGHTGGLAVDAPRVARTDLTETTRSMCLLVRNGGGSRLLGSATQQTSRQTRCIAAARVFAKNQPREEPCSPEHSLAVSPPRPAPSSPTASLPLNPCLPPPVPAPGSIPIAKRKHHVNEPTRKMQCPPASAAPKKADPRGSARNAEPLHWRVRKLPSLVSVACMLSPGSPPLSKNSSKNSVRTPNHTRLVSLRMVRKDRVSALAWASFLR